jgi:hypothetical protein
MVWGQGDPALLVNNRLSDRRYAMDSLLFAAITESAVLERAVRYRLPGLKGDRLQQQAARVLLHAQRIAQFQKRGESCPESTLGQCFGAFVLLRRLCPLALPQPVVPLTRTRASL